MPDDVIRHYDRFASNYHWLYSDRALTGELALEENSDVLATAGTETRILDCSCGIGTLAIALAKRSFAVSGSDGSPQMVEQAVLASQRAGLTIPLTCCTWDALGTHFTDRFDLLFCLGNSIGHTRNRDQMLRALMGMRAVLTEGGALVIQSRDWEQLRKERRRLTHYPWRERDGRRCLPIYIWTFPEEFEAAHTIEVILVFDSGGEVSIELYPIIYYPFRMEQLTACLKSAGFSDIRCKLSHSSAEYRVIATATAQTPCSTPER